MLSIVLCLLGLIIRFSCCRWISLTILESLRTLSTKTVSSNTIFNWLALTVKPPKISPQNITAFFNFMFTPKVSIPPSPSATRSLFPTFAVQERFIFFSIQPCSTCGCNSKQAIQRQSSTCLCRTTSQKLGSLSSKISASTIVLTSRWVAASWSKVGKMKESIGPSFKKMWFARCPWWI